MPTAVVYAATVLIWGSSWIAVYFQLPVVPVVVSIFYRFVLAVGLLLPGLYLLKMLQPTGARDHGFFLLQGVCLFSLNFICFYNATLYMPSGIVSVVFSLATIVNAINNRLIWKEPIPVSIALGGVLGVAGLGLIFSGQLAQQWNAGYFNGLALALAGTYLFSLGNMISARNSRKGIKPLTASAYSMVYGTLLLVLILVFTRQPLVWDPAPRYWIALLYLAVFGTIVAFSAYLTLVARLGPSRAAYATVLFPVIALLLSSVFEGYRWQASAFAGLLLVMFGNVIVMGQLPKLLKAIFTKS